MEFKISDRNYRTVKMPCRVQFHVARRIGPLLASIVEQPESALALQQGIQGMLGLSIMPVAHEAAKMDDAAVDYVLDRCLEHVHFEQKPNLWVPVMTNGILRFPDISMVEMLTMASTIIQEDIGAFLPAPPPASTEAGEAPSSMSSSSQTERDTSTAP